MVNPATAVVDSNAVHLNPQLAASNPVNDSESTIPVLDLSCLNNDRDSFIEGIRKASE